MPLSVEPEVGMTGDLVLEEHHELRGLREDWSQLADASGNVFATWEWADAWTRYLRPRADLAIVVARDQAGQARVILPLFVAARRPLRVLRFIGIGPGDELGPICAPQDRQLAASLLRAHAARLVGGRGVLLAERMLADGVAASLGGQILRRYATPVLQLNGADFADYLATRSRNFRSQLGRAERRLERDHQLVYRLVGDEQDFDPAWQTLVRLHERRWRGGGLHTFIGAHGTFQREFARSALARGWLRLWTMELDGQAVAAWYGLRYGSADYYYQSGRDPEYARLKVGFVLLAHTIRNTFADGLHAYRFGLGDEEYKNRFVNHDPGLQSTALAWGLAGRSSVQAVRLGLYVRDHARRGQASLGG